MTLRLPALSLSIPFVATAILAACSNSTGSNNSVLPDSVRIVSGAATKGFQAYAPDTFTVALGGAASVKVVWRNDDAGVAHTATDTAASPTFSTVLISPGDTASVTFTAAGSYGYECAVHPTTMKGLVIVTP
jgi:plastocyanin